MRWQNSKDSTVKALVTKGRLLEKSDSRKDRNLPNREPELRGQQQTVLVVWEKWAESALGSDLFLLLTHW